MTWSRRVWHDRNRYEPDLYSVFCFAAVFDGRQIMYQETELKMAMSEACEGLCEAVEAETCRIQVETNDVDEVSILRLLGTHAYGEVETVLLRCEFDSSRFRSGSPDLFLEAASFVVSPDVALAINVNAVSKLRSSSQVPDFLFTDQELLHDPDHSQIWEEIKTVNQLQICTVKQASDRQEWDCGAFILKKFHIVF